MKDKRCVHIDFHTSEYITGVGAQFDAGKFKENIRKAEVDSVTLFAKCHHGCFYYEDTAFFKHPYLCGSLLDKQVQACKEIGVSAKIYISAGCDEHIANEHPEWVTVLQKGCPQPSGFGFRRICFNTPYLDILKAQTEEVIKKYNPDGLFYDLIDESPCYCKNCLASMKAKGLDPENEADAKKHAVEVLGKYLYEINTLAKSLKPDVLIFHNGGDFPVGRKDRLDCCDQLETESLPTGHWGYDHFPLTMSYIRRKGKNCIGMTGKFHKAWGEFGSYKYKEALRYEAAQCLAFNAGFCVGDQLHPSGIMDDYTYENIGNANRYIKERDAWRGGECVSEIAIYSPFCGNGRIGLSRILFEEKILFDMIELEEVSQKYKAIVLCEDAPLSLRERDVFQTYCRQGGKLLCVGKNALFEEKLAFDLGCEFLEEDEETPCYIQARYPLKYADKTALVIYEKAYRIQATGRILADKYSPYFKRAWPKFCSHQHTPHDYDKQGVAITEGNDGIYVAADLFSQYAKDGSLTAKQLIVPLLDKLIGGRILQTDLPTSGKAVLYQKDGDLLCHLLYANTIKRGDGVEIIEDIVTLSKVNVSIRCAKQPKEVFLRPSGESLPFRYDGERVYTSIKDFNCYEILEIVMEK